MFCFSHLSTLIADQVLNDNVTAANILAKAIHKPVTCKGKQFSEQLDVDLKGENLGVWIDPIGKVQFYVIRQVKHFRPS